MRKYEIYLPLTYNDGKPIEHEKMKRIREELVALFGSFTMPDRKAWKCDGATCLEIVKIEIITNSDNVPKKRLKAFKERLKDSLQQNDIVIMTHGIQLN